MKIQTGVVKCRSWPENIGQSLLRVLILVFPFLLSGCQVYQLDRESFSTTTAPLTDTARVPFTVVGSGAPSWLIPESEALPEVSVSRITEKSKSGTVGFNGLSFIGYMLSLTLIPYHEEIPYTDIYSIQWQDTPLLESRVDYVIDHYFSVYFPTPMLFMGSLSDGDNEKQLARGVAEDLHRNNLIVAIEQQRAEFEAINPKTSEEIADFLAGPGKQSVYRPLAIQRLISMAPADNALAYHARNLDIPGYWSLLPEQHQAWLTGPEGLRGWDLYKALNQGVPEDELLIRILNAYPAQSADLPHSYYSNLTDSHRKILKEGGLPAGLVDRMTNEEPPRALLVAARTGKLRDADGNIRIPTEAELTEQLVRTDNLGKYLSPYTSDDVLAEWVNNAINANIGATVGSGVGAAAGAYLGDKALEQVPFIGSFIGGAVGAEIGKATGREAAISASGGWELIRETSDRSFDDIESMARYLKAKYGHTENFADAIAATAQIYPELTHALAQAQ